MWSHISKYQGSQAKEKALMNTRSEGQKEENVPNP